MGDFNNILAVIQNNEDAKSVLSKVKMLAAIQCSQKTGAGADENAKKTRIHALQVAYESLADLDIDAVEATSELKNFVLQAEEQSLKGDIATCGVVVEDIECATLWGRKLWEVVLHAAESVDADIIVKPLQQSRRSRLLRTPDDWNLLRHSSVPVLLCGDRRWADAPRVLAAVDAFDEGHTDLNARILQVADKVTQGLRGSMQLVSACPSLDPWSARMNTFGNYQSIMKRIKKDGSNRLEALERSQTLRGYGSRVVEGSIEGVIKGMVADESVDLLVLGTTARSGIEGVIIGNTAEKILHEVQTDVLTVP